MKAVAWVVICASIAQFSVARGAVPASKPADADDAALPAYTPARIADLVKSKAATPHGAGFANQGMGCLTYLWNDSDTHRVFFFSRDGEFLGEFRDEHRDAGRSLEVTEHYLVSGARDRSKSGADKELPFVRKTTTLKWRDNVWIGSTVQWQFLTQNKDGATVRAQPPVVEPFIRRQLTLAIPAELRPKDVEYYVAALRTDQSEHERAFGAWVDVGSDLVRDGKCSFRLDMPLPRSDVTFELRERLPSDPRSANPDELVTTKISSMILNVLAVEDAGPVTFKASPTTRPSGM